MARIKLVDEIAGTETELDVDENLTISATIEQLVRHLGLPWRSTNGALLPYSLVVDGTIYSDHAATLAEAGVVDGTTVTLISPEARDVWSHVRGLVDGLYAEVAGGVRDEVKGAGDRVRASALAEVRGVVGSITGELEAEVTRRIRGTGKQISTWARFRIRRMAKHLATTGALPDELRALSFATGQLSRVAQAAMVAPVAALALAATAAAAAATLEARNASTMAGDALEAAVAANARAEDASSRAVAADSRAAAAEQRADLARSAADTAQESTDAHRADRDDPHSVRVVETVGGHVIEQLGLEPELTTLWLSEVLGAAERKIDAHLSTAYSASGTTVMPGEGDSLWQIAQQVLTGEITTGCDLAGSPSSTRAVAAYVADLWVANVGVIGPDANLIEADQPLQIVCPRA